MKNTQAYVAATPVALFIVIESVAVLLFGPSTTFWIESAFSLVALSLLVAVLLHDPVKETKAAWYFQDSSHGGFICNPADPSSFRSSAKDRCAVRSFGFQHPFTWHVSNYVVCSKCIRESNLRCRRTCLDTYLFNEIKQNQTRTAPRRSTYRSETGNRRRSGNYALRKPRFR